MLYDKMNALYLSSSKLHFPPAIVLNRTVIVTTQNKRSKKNKEPILQYCNTLLIRVNMASPLHVVCYIGPFSRRKFYSFLFLFFAFIQKTYFYLFFLLLDLLG